MNDKILELAGIVLLLGGIAWLVHPAAALIVAGAVLILHVNRPQKAAPAPRDPGVEPAEPEVL